MDSKSLFKTWAPNEGQRFTEFAKPALFVHVDAFTYFHDGRRLEVPSIPMDLVQLHNNQTAIIVDFPSALGVENGIGLAKIGFRPVPLYNGIHETKIGGLTEVVENLPIIDALVAGSRILKDLEISADAPPAFLLDYNRDKEVTSIEGMYDNRWSVGLDDMPDAIYMREAGIKRLVIWTEGDVCQDLAPIIDSYRDLGIEVINFGYGKMPDQVSDHSAIVASSPTENQHQDDFEPISENEEKKSSSTVSEMMQGRIRDFENARFNLLLITILAFVNLFFMFIVNDEPILWTAPSLMWLTYLWVNYTLANIIALMIPIIYLILYLLAQKKRHLIIAALIFFSVDLVVFYLYALDYGLLAFAGGSFAYALLVFILPLAFLLYLVKGARAWKLLQGTTYPEYLKFLDDLDDQLQGGGTRVATRRHFRGYRGYRGYGGSGNGGYSGRGYRGSGGGYGGGYGG